MSGCGALLASLPWGLPASSHWPESSPPRCGWRCLRHLAELAQCRGIDGIRALHGSPSMLWLSADPAAAATGESPVTASRAALTLHHRSIAPPASRQPCQGRRSGRKGVEPLCGAGIEPATRAFKARCSTIELSMPDTGHRQNPCPEHTRSTSTGTAIFCT